MKESCKIKVNKHLDLERLPSHLAIIMDGNGRWATKRGLPRVMGHKAGCEALKKIVEAIFNLGIKFATFFTFSTENWKRPKEEIDGIFNLIREYLNTDTEQFVQKDVRIVISGDYYKLPEDIVDVFEKVINKTKDCKSFTLNLAINYGGRDEILMAVNKAVKNAKTIENADEFATLLYNPDIPNPDFVIRTSGELRISNFMLWQMAYSEFYFTKTYWPAFTQKELQKALVEFQKRKRRFGAI